MEVLPRGMSQTSVGPSFNGPITEVLCYPQHILMVGDSL